MGVKTAIIGLGRMGRSHLEALDRTERLDVVAIVDPSAEVRAFADVRGIVAYSSVLALLGAGGVDAAVVASATSTHLDAVRALARAGVHVLCEKPCGYAAADARSAGEAAEHAGVSLQIGYWKRFVPSLVSLRDRIGRGDLGAISLVSCFQWDERPPSPAFRAASGGPLVDMGVHELDLMRWLTGQDVVAVTAHASTVTFDPVLDGDPESVALVAQLSGGALGLASVGRRFVEGDAHRVHVVGTAGAADIPYIWPPHEVEDFLGALVSQAEGFADAVEDGLLKGASASDAAAALESVALASFAGIER